MRVFYIRITIYKYYNKKYISNLVNEYVKNQNHKNYL